MITREAINEAATRLQTSSLNISREYVQHVFLRSLYRLGGDTEKLLFKGGTALRIVFDSPRFSEDLDFSSFGLAHTQVESLFMGTLSDLEASGLNIELNERSHQTTGGYFGEARFRIYEHDISLEVNVNAKPASDIRGEYKQIHPGLAPNYGLLMLPTQILVDEKITALATRQKPRDFFDLYFMLRANMLPVEVRSKLKELIPVVESTKIDFDTELRIFLPTDHHPIIRDFKSSLLSEIRRNSAG